MSKDYIDVEYTAYDEKEQTSDITINGDPISTVIHETVSGFCGIVNNVTNAVKDYNMCRQQEETKRAEIRATLKIELTRIQAQKELLLKQLDYRHENETLFLENYFAMMMKELDANLGVTKAAIEVAKETKDFTSLIDIMHVNQEIMGARMELISRSIEKQFASFDAANQIESHQPRGLLE